MKKKLILSIAFFACSYMGNTQCNPVISACPANIVQPVSIGNCSSIVNFTPPSFSGCPTGTLVQSLGLPPGSSFPSGMMNIKYEVATPAVIFTEDFSGNNAGWTLGTEWAIGPTVSSGAGGGGTFGDPATDNTPTTDNGVAGVVIGGFATTNLHPMYYLTSPVINASGSLGLSLEFYRWLNSDYTPFMQNSVEVWDGTSWVVLWQSGPSPSIADNAWILQTFDISAYANSALQIRFGVEVASGGAYTVSSWNLDDVKITKMSSTGVSCGFSVNTNIAPVLTSCQLDSTLVNSGAACGEVFTFLPPTATDCSNLTTTLVAGLPSGSVFPVGVTTVQYQVKEDKPIYFFEDFSSNAAGWILGPEWAIGPAMSSTCSVLGGSGNDPSTDHTPTSDNGIAGVVIGGCASTALHSFYYLTSPVINMSSVSGQVELQFYRWLNSDYTPYMQNQVEVYNGSSWVVLWQSGPSPSVLDNSWQFQKFDVTNYLNANFQIRFGFNVASGGVYTIGQWNIDDVSLTTPGLALSTTCSFLVTVPPYQIAVADSFCANSSYTFGSQTLTSGGTYTEVFPGNGGCDSTVVLTLTENPNLGYNINATICAGSSYFFDAQYLTVSGFYMDIFQTVAGCDSTIVLNLTVDPPITNTINASICAGSSYVFGSQTLTSGGVYIDTVQTSGGCDSIVTLNLTHHALPALSIVTVNDELLGSDGSVSINVGGGSSYSFLWSNGATTQNISGLVAGPYSVTVTDLATNCTSTLQATVGTQVGLDEIGMKNVLIYPNPSKGKFTISSKNELIEHLLIYDATGRLVYEMHEGIEAEQTIDLSNVQRGLYQIRLIGDSKTAVKSIVIQ